MKSGAEAGTAEYMFGAAIWLNQLGYKYEKVNLT